MGRWIPKIDDVTELIKGDGSLITKTAEQFNLRIKQDRILKRLRDGYGVVGYETEKSILCAKDYIFGWVVSCHQGLLDYAIEQNKKLIMYIGRNDKFYAFNPNEINGTVNLRAGIKMMNFDIREGTNLETSPEQPKESVVEGDGLGRWINESKTEN